MIPNFDLNEQFSASMNSKPSLLIVDDQTMILHSLYQIFRDEYEVFIATSGEEAIAACEKHVPDLILLDMVMLGIDGYETCRRLKDISATSEVPIIFVTAHSDAEEETRCLDAGAVDFIVKPVNPRVVKSRVSTHIRLKKQSDLLRRSARIDGLTGVANRRFFDETLLKEWRSCTRNQIPLSLIFIDVDYFKRFNDFYGHQMGDICLQAIALALMNKVSRPNDLVARYGGEEFICLLPETPLSGAIAKANELQLTVRNLEIAHEKSDAANVVTISLGVVSTIPQPNDDPAVLIAQADHFLYQAKQAGRAQVAFAGSA